MKDLLIKRLLPLVSVVLISLFFSGCKGRLVPSVGGRNMEDTYIHAHGEGAKDLEKRIKKELTIKESYGYVKPYVPVVEPPEVKKVWIPDHIGEDNILVGGHWIFIMTKEPTWYIQDKSSPSKRIPVIVPYKDAIKE